MRKALLTIAFAAIAMISGGIVSVGGMNDDTVGAEGTSQVELVETVQSENERIAQAEIKSVVQTKEVTFSCDVLGCTQTEVHQHGLCGIDGCTQIGEHSHSVCSVAGCTETGTHMHNGEYCYPHSSDDGHAYHNCGVAGCTEMENHTHGACGIDGCTQIGEHSHSVCSVTGCTETGTHMHNGEYCYPHSSDDGHAYHNCGVAGCTQIEEHSHGENHRQSSHHGGGHH